MEMFPVMLRRFRRLPRDDREALGGTLLVLSCFFLLLTLITSSVFQDALFILFFIGAVLSIKMVS